MKKIKEYRDFHAADFDSLKDTIKAGNKIREFDFYFDYVIKLAENLRFKS